MDQAILGGCQIAGIVLEQKGALCTGNFLGSTLGKIMFTLGHVRSMEAEAQQEQVQKGEQPSSSWLPWAGAAYNEAFLDTEGLIPL